MSNGVGRNGGSGRLAGREPYGRQIGDMSVIKQPGGSRNFARWAPPADNGSQPHAAAAPVDLGRLFPEGPLRIMHGGAKDPLTHQGALVHRVGGHRRPA